MPKNEKIIVMKTFFERFIITEKDKHLVEKQANIIIDTTLGTWRYEANKKFEIPMKDYASVKAKWEKITSKQWEDLLLQRTMKIPW